LRGARPPPSYSIVTITYKVAVYALAERAGADTLPLFHLYPYVLCGPGKGFLPYQTGLYTFSLQFVLNEFNVVHPVEAQFKFGLYMQPNPHKGPTFN
jgi:hypothetical protein